MCAAFRVERVDCAPSHIIVGRGVQVTQSGEQERETVSVEHQLPVGVELLKTSEAARLANIGQRTLWRWSRSGLAPAPVKIGLGPRPSVRFVRAEFVEWIEAGCPRVVDAREL